jgi:plasmid segregation protein ParM
MNNNILIAVDAGKSSCKSVTKIQGKIERNQFRTKVQEVENLGIDIPPNTFKVEFNSKVYLVGEAVSEEKVKYDISKKSIEHLISIYLSVAKFVEKTGISTVSLAIGTPLNIYKNKLLKEEYGQYIQGNGMISIKVDGRLIYFKISRVFCLPEGTGPIYSDINKYKNGKTTIVDIGGLNVNYCVFNDLVPQYEQMIINNLGVNILRSKITEKLSAEYGVYISDGDVDGIIKDGYLYINGEVQFKSKSLIQDLMKSHIQDIINYGKSRGLTLFNANGAVVFSGGGSLLLKHIIKELYPSAIIVDDAQFANVLSFLTILEVKCEKA